MPRSSNSQEHPSTYFVQDRSNAEEMKRLLTLDQLLTTGMGGILPEQPDPTAFQQILDVGCGPGGWLREVARTYPSASLLLGVDISHKIIEYARAQTEAEGLSDRVEFHLMDALRLLEFPVNYFDLVNHCSATSWLRTWDWPNILHQYQRVCKSGGIIRMTEFHYLLESHSPAFSHIGSLFTQAMHQSGHFFAAQEDGGTRDIAQLARQSGLQHVQTRTCMLEYRTGTPEWQNFFENNRRGFRTVLPFMQKWIRVPDDYDILYQQMLDEMQHPDFVARMEIVTVWGKKP